jgi:hypothetical protein
LKAKLLELAAVNLFVMMRSRYLSSAGTPNKKGKQHRWTCAV